MVPSSHALSRQNLAGRGRQQRKWYGISLHAQLSHLADALDDLLDDARVFPPILCALTSPSCSDEMIAAVDSAGKHVPRAFGELQLISPLHSLPCLFWPLIGCRGVG